MDFQQIEDAIYLLHGPADAAHAADVVLMRLYVHIEKGLSEISNEIFKSFGLNPVSFTALMMLYGTRPEPLNPSLVCEITGESRANMTRISDDLVALGLIQRETSEQDRRRFALTITPAGTRLVRKVLPLLKKRVTPAFAGFDQKEKTRLHALLRKQLLAVEQARSGARA
jgi:MarR family transcriptional repressor of emrRAB